MTIRQSTVLQEWDRAKKEVLDSIEKHHEVFKKYIVKENLVNADYSEKFNENADIDDFIAKFEGGGAISSSKEIGAGGEKRFYVKGNGNAKIQFLSKYNITNANQNILVDKERFRCGYCDLEPKENGDATFNIRLGANDTDNFLLYYDEEGNRLDISHEEFTRRREERKGEHFNNERWLDDSMRTEQFEDFENKVRSFRLINVKSLGAYVNDLEENGELFFKELMQGLEGKVRPEIIAEMKKELSQGKTERSVGSFRL